MILKERARVETIFKGCRCQLETMNHFTKTKQPKYCHYITGRKAYYSNLAIGGCKVSS